MEEKLNLIIGMMVAAAIGIVGYIGAYAFLTRNVTYSGQCGPIVFDYARLEFSLSGSVTSITKSNVTVNISSIPCIYRKD